MKHRLLSSLAVTVVATGTCLAVARQAEASETTARAWAAGSLPAASPSQESVSPPTLLANADPEALPSAASRQTARSAVREAAIASLYRHERDGQAAATLFVRGLPLLTFFGDAAAEASKTSAEAATSGFVNLAELPAGDAGAASSDPVQRAAAIAHRLNQLDFSSFNAAEITAAWDAERNAYAIRTAGETLALIDRQTQLADSTGNWEQDVLQATNRLRRWLGNAEPLSLSELAAPPAARRSTDAPQIAVGSAQVYQSGMASWYGPGLHGRRSASGERFDQHALTAAHRTLPFGTQVRVTNLNNGQSVVVRINDRGPFSHSRVIDLSRAAASALGMLGSGVAPVQLETIGR